MKIPRGAAWQPVGELGLRVSRAALIALTISGLFGAPSRAFDAKPPATGSQPEKERKEPAEKAQRKSPPPSDVSLDVVQEVEY